MKRLTKQRAEPENSSRVAQGRFTAYSRENELANSPMMTAQRLKLQNLFGSAAQLKGPEERPLQGRFQTAQRVEEEEPVQGKVETAQRFEEEEPLQGKFATVQRVEEDEPLQGKFGTVQRVEEDEPLQGKFSAVKQLLAYLVSSKVAQLRKDKRVEDSATGHYTDGWGAKYGIQDDATLKGRVPDSVKGNGSINLGFYESRPRWWFQGKQYKKFKLCTIIYKDGKEGWGKYESKYTSIYHCGPSGEPIVEEV
jgi:hypothetical protein